MDPRSNTNLDVGGPAPTSIPDHMRGLESNGKESEEMPQKSRSILNLTSSTLFGIYSPAGYDANREEPIPLTPWGTGAQTPSRTTSVDISAWKGAVEKLQATSEKNPQRPESSGKRRRSMRKHHRPRTTAARLVMLASRTAALFVSGLAYGEVISHLHDSGNIAPVRVDGIRRDTWEYLVFWGFAGAVLGSLLPVLDSIERRQGSPVAAEDERSASPDSVEDDGYQEKEGNGRYARQGRSGLSAEWNPIVRSIGAFVGIAFAIVSFLFSFSPYPGGGSFKYVLEVSCFTFIRTNAKAMRTNKIKNDDKSTEFLPKSKVKDHYKHSPFFFLPLLRIQARYALFKYRKRKEDKH